MTARNEQQQTEVSEAIINRLVAKIEKFEDRTGHRFMGTLPDKMQAEIEAARRRDNARRRSR